MVITAIMKPILKLMVPLALSVLLVGCGNSSQSGSSKKAETQTSQSSKKSDKTTTSAADKASSSSNASTSASSDSNSDANYRVESSSTTNAASTSSADTSSDVTTSQSADQTSSATQTHTVYQSTLTERIYRLLSGAYARQDLIMQISQTSPNIYTVQVRENHQSPNMRAKYVDPSTSPTVAWFKTNSTGQLLRSDDGGATYYVVGTAY